MPRFAANLSMMFTERAFLDRFAAAANAGFDAVECLFPYDFAAEDIKKRLAANGLDLVLFNMPPGNAHAGDRGLACLPGREAEFAAGRDLAIGYARTLRVPRLHAMAGRAPDGVAPDIARTTYIANIANAAAVCADAGIDVLIEPINPFDIPGYFLNDFGMALDIIAEITAAGGPAPRLQFDIYHCQRIHGDVPAWIERCAPFIAHYQIAGAPGRHEPDSGDLPFAEIIDAVDHVTPGLAIGCEYTPTGRTEDGLGWFAPYAKR